MQSTQFFLTTENHTRVEVNIIKAYSSKKYLAIKENTSRVRFSCSSLVSVIVTVRRQLRQFDSAHKITLDSATGQWGFGLTVDTSKFNTRTYAHTNIYKNLNFSWTFRFSSFSASTWRREKTNTRDQSRQLSHTYSYIVTWAINFIFYVSLRRSLHTQDKLICCLNGCIGDLTWFC